MVSIKNILYIYGYGSSPNSTTYNWLKKDLYDKNVVCYWYNQRNPEEAILELTNIVKDNDIDLIIGSSLGGWFSMHVASKTSKPCILINPLTDKYLKKVLFDVSNGDVALVNTYIKYQELHPLFKANENSLELWDNFENGNQTVAVVGDRDEVIVQDKDYDISNYVYKTMIVGDGKHQLTDIQKKKYVNLGLGDLLNQLNGFNQFLHKSEIIP
jgi:predicted esterase YcpF (UPF0227 family)